MSEAENRKPPKIVPIRQNFENMQALLARIAEDDEANGFIGVVLRKDGDEMVVVTFDATRAEVALAALMLQQNALEEEE